MSRQQTFWLFTLFGALFFFVVTHWGAIAGGSLSHELAQNTWAGRLGYAIGSILGSTLPAALLAFLVSRPLKPEEKKAPSDSERSSKRTVWPWIAVFCILCIALSVFAYLAGYAGYNAKREALTAVESYQREWGRIANEVASTSDLPSRIEPPDPITPSAGEAGAVLAFVNEFVGRAVAQRNDYLLELEAIGWNSILDAGRLKNDLGLIESKAMIERARAIVDKYAEKTSHLMDDGRAMIADLNISEASKREVLAGFDGGVVTANEQIARQWALERDAVTQIENMVLLLADSKNWTVDNGLVAFYDQAELDRYNQYFANLQKTVEEQQAMLTESSSSFNGVLEAMKQALRD